jgi:hypothetical protein
LVFVVVVMVVCFHCIAAHMKQRHFRKVDLCNKRMSLLKSITRRTAELEVVVVVSVDDIIVIVAVVVVVLETAILCFGGCLPTEEERPL